MKKGAGRFFTYNVKLKNTAKAAPVSELSFTVLLPDDVVYVKSRTDPPAKQNSTIPASKSGWGTFSKPRIGTPIWNATANAVTWNGLYLPPRRHISFSVRVRAATTKVGDKDKMVFRGILDQRLPVNGLSYCRIAAFNTTMHKSGG